MFMHFIFMRKLFIYCLLFYIYIFDFICIFNKFFFYFNVFLFFLILWGMTSFILFYLFSYFLSVFWPWLSNLDNKFKKEGITSSNIVPNWVNYSLSYEGNYVYTLSYFSISISPWLFISLAKESIFFVLFVEIFR